MGLKITRASDPIVITRLNICVYGPPGIGKTSLAFTASRPLLLDFDQGAHRAAGRKDTVQVHQWGDVAGIAAGDLSEFDTIIVDAPAAGHMLTFLQAPMGLSDAVRVGPIKRQSEWLVDMLTDPKRSRVHLVTLAEEMPVSETLADLLRRMGAPAEKIHLHRTGIDLSDTDVWRELTAPGAPFPRTAASAAALNWGWRWPSGFAAY